jgi:hypothetical protein
MKKRLKKKLAKRQGRWPPLSIKTPVASISVTKVSLAFNSVEETSEEEVSRFDFSVTDVAALAKDMQRWVAECGYSNNAKPCFHGHRGSCEKTLFIDTPAQDSSRPIWFVGDLHGDLTALKALTDFARAQDKRDKISAPTRLFFLGDLTDGAPFSAEVTAWVMQHCDTGSQAVQEALGARNHAVFEVMAVAGNHDVGLCFIEDDLGGKFVSTVSPSTFAEELNERMKDADGGTWIALGLAAIDFFKILPRMVMLDKIVMVAHGGVPHSDVPLAKREDLDSSQALSDFVWNRLHETAPKKIPNRESRGSQLGVKDFDGFIFRLTDTEVAGFAPKVFIRGHDHHDGNFKRYESYKSCLVVTLNAFTVNRDSYGQKYRDLALLRWVPKENERMTLFRLKFQDGSLEEMWRTLAPGQRNINAAGEK